MDFDDRGLARLVREHRRMPPEDELVRGIVGILENYESHAGALGAQGVVLTEGVPYGSEALRILKDAGVLSVDELHDPQTEQDAFLELDAERLNSYAERSNVYDDPLLRTALGSHAKDGPSRIESSDAIAGGMYELLANFARSGSEHLSVREYGGKHALEAARQLRDLGVLDPLVSEQGPGQLYSVDEDRLNVLVESCAPYQ